VPRISAADRLIAELETMRNYLGDEIGKLRREPTRWYESSQVWSSVIAILALVITPTVAYETQLLTKRQEFALEQLRTSSSRQEDALANLYDQLSATLHATEDRLRFATGEYAQLDAGQRRAVFDTANAVDQRWERGREKLGFLLGLYFIGDSDVTTSWQKTRGALQAYVDCGEAVYLRYWDYRKTGRAPANSCHNERSAADAALSQLSEVVLVAHGRRLQPR